MSVNLGEARAHSSLGLLGSAYKPFRRFLFKDAHQHHGEMQELEKSGNVTVIDISAEHSDKMIMQGKNRWLLPIIGSYTGFVCVSEDGCSN